MTWPDLEAAAVRFHNAGIPAGLTAQVATVVDLAGLAEVTALGARVISTPEAGAVMARFLSDAKTRGIPDRDTAAALGSIARIQTALHDARLQVDAGGAS
jgi:hypothetical protein